MKRTKQTKFKQTELGNGSTPLTIGIREGWKRTTLGEISSAISYGYTASASDIPVGPKFLRITDIQDDYVDWHAVPYCQITDEDRKKYQLDSGDICIARTGASTGTNYTVKNKVDAVFASYLIRYRINRSVADPFYIGFLIKSPKWKNFVDSVIGGSAQPGANAKQFASFEFILPSLQEQHAIAKILSDLDKKIELNHQMNKTMESIAQAIFKKWFVDFEFPGYEKKKFVNGLPEGWRHGTLGEIISIESGKRPGEKSGTKTQDFTVPLIGASSVMGFVKDALYNEPVLIIGRVGTHGIIQRILLPSFPSDNTIVIRSKYFEFVYQVLKTIDYESLNIGTTQPLITQTSINKYDIVIPNNNILEKFEDYMSGLFEKVEANNRKSKSLIDIRDSLLPRLMAGKIRVNS